MVRSSDLVGAPLRGSLRILCISFMCAFAQELVGKAFGKEEPGRRGTHKVIGRSVCQSPSNKPVRVVCKSCVSQFVTFLINSHGSGSSS